jgi:hypothetical protein
MNPRFLYIYLLALRGEVQAAVHAYHRIGQARVTVQEAEDWDLEAEGALFERSDAEDDLAVAIEGLLSAHARASLLLFPHPSAGARGSSRGKELRVLLNVPDDHGLARREPRNTWMHLDERIDARIWEGDGEDLILRHFGDADFAAMDGYDRRILRLIDPGSLEILLLGDRYDLRTLYNDVARLSPRLDEAIRAIEREIHPDLSNTPEPLPAGLFDDPTATG